MKYLLVLLTACGAQSYIDPSLIPHVESFQREANKRGHHVDIRGYEIKVQDLTTIDRDFNCVDNKVLVQEPTEQLVYSALSVCIVGARELDYYDMTLYKQIALDEVFQ